MLSDYKDWPHFSDAITKANKYIDEVLFHKAHNINVSESDKSQARNRKKTKKNLTRLFKVA